MIRRISIFSGADWSTSITRYADHLRCEFERQGFDAYVYSTLRRPGLPGLIDKYFGYVRLAQKNQADVNVLASESIAYLLPWIDRSRTVVVCHDVIPLVLKIRSLRYRLWFRVLIHMMHLAHGILTISYATRKDLGRLFPSLPPDKIITRHNGVLGAPEGFIALHGDESVRRFAAQHGLEGHFIVFHIGNDSVHKNFLGVIEGFARCGVPDAKLFKVGEIGEGNRHRIRELGIEQNIVHIQRLDDKELLLAFNASSVLVFPSLWEGFGFPPIEAMNVEVPVITTRRGSLEEVCGDAVLYTEPDDYDAIGEAIHRVAIDQRLRGELTRRGLQRAGLFRWSHVVEGILSFFPE